MLKRFFIFLPLLLIALFFSCSPVNKIIHSDEVLKWEGDMQVFDSLNAVEFADENTLLLAGSSSVRIWRDIQTDLAPFQVMQRGYGGAKLSDFNYYVDRIIKPQPFKAILIFVANDIAGRDQDSSPKEVFQLYKALVKQVQQRNPDTPLFWIEVTPTPSRWEASEQIREASALIRSHCDRNEDLYFLDTYDVFMNQEALPDSALFRDDMLHLNQDGYQLWSETILEALEEEGITP